MDLSPKSTSNNNDLDYPTFQKLIAAIKDNIENKSITKPEFILLLGDIQSHKRRFNNFVENQIVVFNTIQNSFSSIPILFVFGNNDSPQKNYGLFSHEKSSPFKIAKRNTTWKNGFLSTGIKCNNKLYPCLKNEVKSDGYYSAFIAHKLRLISLNSVLFSINNTNKKQAKLQLNWLQEQLSNAEKNNESILIAMHIPPGRNIYDNSKFWRQNELDEFLKYTKKYQKHIIGMLFGHTHYDEIKILRNESITTGIYGVASLSTSHGNTPGIKVFHLSKINDNWSINNYISYRIEGNKQQLQLIKVYDFNSYYSCENKNNINQCLNNINSLSIKKLMLNANANITPTLQYPNNIELQNIKQLHVRHQTRQVQPKHE